MPTVDLSAEVSSSLGFPIVSIWKDAGVVWADGSVVWYFGVKYPNLSVNSRVEALTCRVNVLYPRTSTVVLRPETRVNITGV